MRYGKDPRIKSKIGIAVDMLRGVDEGPQSGRSLHMTEDVSRCGLRFRTAQPLPVDARVRICVALQSPAKTITQVGRVRWTSPHAGGGHTIGVELSQVSPMDALYWNDHVVSLQAARSAA